LSPRARIASPTLALVALAAAACAGPPAAEGDVPGLVIARFEDARALAAGPGGALYVVDAGASTVVVIGPEGAVAVLGGAGVGEGAFLDPADIDPTNGQALFVADAGAGTVTHLTAEGRTAEVVAVPQADASRAARAVGPDLGAEGRGRPVALAAAPDGALYVVEAERGVVLRLGDTRGVERVLGGAEAGAARLVRPVDLAVADDGTLWVADAGRGAVQAFDPFGAPGLAVAVRDVGGSVAVEVVGGTLLVTGPAAVGTFTTSGEAVALWPLDLGESLVGAVETSLGTYVLTRTRLVRLDAR
jgi:DNA-binding beta-propeller fold protein YncE